VEQIAASWERFTRELEETGKTRGGETGSTTPGAAEREPKALGANLAVNEVHGAAVPAAGTLSAAAEKLKARIERECEELTGTPCKVGARYDPDWGCVYEVAWARARERLWRRTSSFRRSSPESPSSWSGRARRT
jgi:hypothetical protein